MRQPWRPILKKHIEDLYIRNPQEEWYDVDLFSSGILDITIISDEFTGIPHSKRKEQIIEILRESNAPTATGVLYLHTLREARNIPILRPSVEQPSRVNT